MSQQQKAALVIYLKEIMWK